MEPQHPTTVTAETLAALERYVVEGESALVDPVVAEAVVAHGTIVAELARAMEVLRQPIQARRSERGSSGDTVAGGILQPLLREVPYLQGVRGRGRVRRRVGGLGTRTLRRWIALSATALALAIAVVLLQPVRRIPVGIARMYVTGSGQQATVTASDGTQFILSQNTTLRLFDFAAHTRTVVVDGEAYINVAHASGLPFIVQGGNINVQVLGTGFLIRHDAGARMRVAVTDGKVRLITKSKHGVGVTLTAGQIGDVIDSTVSVSSVNELSPRTEWTQEQLVFHDTPLSTILAKISQWYGYQFRYSDSTLARKTLTLGVSTHSSMKALAEIERVLHVNISVVGDTVTLIPQPPKNINGTSRLSAYDVWIPNKEVGR